MCNCMGMYGNPWEDRMTLLIIIYAPVFPVSCERGFRESLVEKESSPALESCYHVSLV